MKICRIATVPFFLWNHLRSQIDATVNAGHDVVLVSQKGPEVASLNAIQGARFVEVAIERKISLLSDIGALVMLYRLFRDEQFDIVHTTTPKAGLLGSLASFAARVPVRLHTFTGQVWVEMSGVRRAIVAASDWITSRFVSHSYADSFSQRDFLIAELGIPSHRISVLGQGSLSGVDLARFSRERFSQSSSDVRQELGIPIDHRVIAFVGRVTRDKGIVELLQAFEMLHRRGLSVSLLLIGPEEDDAMAVYEMGGLSGFKNIYRLGYQRCPEMWLLAADLLCIPSYREGFGNVVIEAAAMGLPSVGTDIVGLRDSIVDGETGLLVPVKDSQALADALTIVLMDDAFRAGLGVRAQRRAVEWFDAKFVNNLILDDYIARQAAVTSR